MNKLNFKDLKPETKREMSELIGRWKRTKTDIHTLIEGLSTLAAEKRMSAGEVSKLAGDEVASITNTWGKGNRARLALEKEHASLLLGLVMSIEEAANEDYGLAGRMVETADSVLFKGGKVPSTITDPSWERVLEVLASVDPSLCQRALF
jgi:hypothetical protein